MINHARTLLLNKEGPYEPDPLIAGDEYIPEFTPITLSVGLQSVYNQLFGTISDYEGRLYRTAQYMSVLHSTEYAAYVTELDSRITYDPRGFNVMADGEYGTIVNNYTNQLLTVTGEWDATALLGRSITKWRLTGLAGNYVNVENVTDGLSNVQQAFAGNVLTLVGSDLVFNFEGNSIVVGDSWEVIHKLRPEPDLSAILSALQNPTDVVEAELYGEDPLHEPEPYRTFHNLVQKHYALPFRLSGALLAYIYRLEALR